MRVSIWHTSFVLAGLVGCSGGTHYGGGYLQITVSDAEGTLLERRWKGPGRDKLKEAIRKDGSLVGNASSYKQKGDGPWDLGARDESGELVAADFGMPCAIPLDVVSINLSEFDTEVTWLFVQADEFNPEVVGEHQHRGDALKGSATSTFYWRGFGGGGLSGKFGPDDACWASESDEISVAIDWQFDDKTRVKSPADVQIIGSLGG